MKLSVVYEPGTHTCADRYALDDEGGWWVERQWPHRKRWERVKYSYVHRPFVNDGRGGNHDGPWVHA